MSMTSLAVAIYVWSYASITTAQDLLTLRRNRVLSGQNIYSFIYLKVFLIFTFHVISNLLAVTFYIRINKVIALFFHQEKIIPLIEAVYLSD